MFCTYCGKQNADSANFCAACGSAISGDRLPTTTAKVSRPFASLPFIVKAFSVAFVVLGLAVAVTGVVLGADRASQSDTSLPALQNFSTALGGILVAVYGMLILRRNPATLGRWWFIATWPMNFLTPFGLFFLALVVTSTLILRNKHAQLFRRPA